MKALAMAILCFYPPLNYPPEEPTEVLIPRLPIFFSINYQALEFFKASLISSSVASDFPKRMFSFIEVLNKTGSYPT
tara:strand:+ start:330 stop:560 length:231 start_codon:yes stop_codon:yes gene_type:complete